MKPFRFKYTNSWKVKGFKNFYPSKSNHNIAGLAILMSDKIDFKQINISRGKEEKDICMVNPLGIYEVFNICISQMIPRIHKAKTDKIFKN